MLAGNLVIGSPIDSVDVLEDIPVGPDGIPLRVPPDPRNRSTSECLGVVGIT